jgi:hypothetical protein
MDVRELCFAEDLDTRRDQAMEVTCEGETGLLDPRVTNGTTQASGAGDASELDLQVPVADQVAHCDFDPFGSDHGGALFFDSG